MPRCKDCKFDDSAQEWLERTLEGRTREFRAIDAFCDECGSHPCHEYLGDHIDSNVNKIRYRCRECGDVHHPGEREEHTILSGTTVCPGCGSKRAGVVRDLQGKVSMTDLST